MTLNTDKSKPQTKTPQQNKQANKQRKQKKQRKIELAVLVRQHKRILIDVNL